MQWLKEENPEWETNTLFLLIDDWLKKTNQNLSVIDNREWVIGASLQDQLRACESCLSGIDELLLMVQRALDVLREEITKVQTDR